MSLSIVKQKLQHCSDVTYYEMEVNQEVTCTFIYIKSITQQKMLQDIFGSLLKQTNVTNKSLLKKVASGMVFPAQTEVVDQVDDVVLGVLDGKVAMLVKGITTYFLLPMTQYQTRAVEGSQNEMVIIGPQEAFIEDINTNISLIRRRLRHPDFKMTEYAIGEYTKTKVCMVYIDGLCPPDLISQIEHKIRQIQDDFVMGASHIAEYLEENPASPFPEIQYTERPDTLSASILEGRLGLIINGTPIALILPVTFFTLMQSAEDYYQRFWAASWIRWIRYLFLVISFLLPSAYIAITTFHPEMIPSNVLTVIAAARENIPFPTLVEALMMEITFEGLREAGIRIPKPIGQTISIIGAIVIGQAAVQAGIVSAPVVIVVSITGIASFILPHFELGLTFRLLRFPIMVLGGVFGLFGVILGVFLIFWHLVTLTSYGKPYMQPFAPIVWSEWKDIFYRTSWKNLTKGPQPYNKKKKKL